MRERHKHRCAYACASGGAKTITVLQAIQPSPVQNLVKYLNTDTSQITRVIQLPEAKNLVARQKSESDGRVELVSLTVKGEKLASKLESVPQKTIHDVMSPLDKAERKAFNSLLRKLM